MKKVKIHHRLPFSILMAVFFISSLLSAAVNFTDSNLPIVIINTNGQAIPDAYKIQAEMQIIDNGGNQRNYLTDTPNDYDGYIGIELRGSSSQMFPKKQFGVETWDADGNDIDVSLLGLPEEEDWILHAPYSDKTLMRNALAYHLSRKMGWYASRTRYCELILNGDYHGVYILMEKIKRDKNRVDIAKLNPDEISGDDLTGGYILKIDKWTGEDNDGWESAYPPYPGAWQKTSYQYHVPKASDIVPEQKNYIQNYITGFENLMRSNSWNDPESGYYSSVNFQSFADVFILGEISKNVDAFRLSAFMYKNKTSKDDRLTMGPIWDYNLAFANANYYKGWETQGFQLDYFFNNADFRAGDPFCAPFWWKSIRQDPVFLEAVAARWFDLRQTELHFASISAVIDSFALLLDESSQRNFQRWPVIGAYVWPNYFIGQSWAQEIDYMKGWIQLRLAWMDGELANYLGTSAPQLPQEMLLIQNYPNPFNGKTVIHGCFPLGERVTVGIFALDGTQLLKKSLQNVNTGEFSFIWNGEGHPSGLYFVKMTAGHRYKTRKILLLK
ncbi:MAG TPA: T9SS type A sorting domain-containing protein [Candidatus Marinimicrobia bacterium]|nr:T9SS type A sorting domain-containing protein [Candidatus Neomarinimicrobiota bacterium]